MKLAGRVLTRGAEGTDMPEGVKPPARRSDTEPLQLSTVFRGVQVLQTAITRSWSSEAAVTCRT